MDPERLMYRLLHLNVAAVHTTSLTYLNYMFDISLNTGIHDELRNEIKGAVKTYAQLTRAVKKDFIFSDDTTAPKGLYVLALMYAMYLDDAIYPNASTFDASRFSRLREEPSNENRYQFVTTPPTYINFGHGKDACSRRFFAVREIKLLLAHTLFNYDVRLEDPSGGLPKLSWYDRLRKPNQTARVLFRKR